MWHGGATARVEGRGHCSMGLLLLHAIQAAAPLAVAACGCCGITVIVFIIVIVRLPRDHAARGRRGDEQG